MTDETIKTTEARELWRRLPREPQPREPMPADELGSWDANALAAHLEGTLSAREADRLEARLDEQPALLETLLAADDAGIGRRDAALPPKSLIARAKELGPGNGANRRLSVPRPANENRRRWGTRIEWAAVAAALVVFAGIGFELGSDTGRGAKKIQIAMASGTGLDFDLEGQVMAAGFSLEDADDAFNRGEI